MFQRSNGQMFLIQTSYLNIIKLLYIPKKPPFLPSELPIVLLVEFQSACGREQQMGIMELIKQEAQAFTARYFSQHLYAGHPHKPSTIARWFMRNFFFTL